MTTYTYDAWGKMYASSTSPIIMYNPLTYRGYVYDRETGLYYLQSRYYNPEWGRFLNADVYAATGQGLLGNNMFAYCLNSPVFRYDNTGTVSKEKAEEIIKKNKYFIITAGEEFGVDPVAIAACIYIEQTRNVNWIDYLTDYSFYFVDTSVGIGQVKVSTAQFLEDNGYIGQTGRLRFKITKRGTRLVGFHSRKQAIADKLCDDYHNIRYVAAYLKYHQDTWRNVYDISGRIDILTTLFNIGYKTPNSNPQPGLFGTIYLEIAEEIKKLLE